MNEISEREVKMRCIEAASRAPNAHMHGYSKGVLQDASDWSEWIFSERAEPEQPNDGTVNDFL